MALSTFGAIMGFAAEMVNQTKTAYEALTEKAKDPELREVLGQLGACRRNSHLGFFVVKSGNQKPMSDLFLPKMVTKSVKRKQKWEAAISKENSSTGS
jgi:hypothetical protein